jgi:anti-sigma factor RsiW
MSWTCEQVEARLGEYVDGLLSAAERAEFETHARGCKQCAPLVSSVASLVNGLHGLELVEEPAWLAGRILDRTLGPRKAKWSWGGVSGWFGWLVQPKLAYGAASVAITVAVLLSTLGFSWRKPKLADLNPVNAYRTANRQSHLVYARGAKFVSDLRVVYEIQTRLRPENDVQGEPQNAPQRNTNPHTPPGVSNGPDQNRPRQQNRANDLAPHYVVLASTLACVSERSLR